MLCTCAERYQQLGDAVEIGDESAAVEVVVDLVAMGPSGVVQHGQTA